MLCWNVKNEKKKNHEVGFTAVGSPVELELEQSGAEQILHPPTFSAPTLSFWFSIAVYQSYCVILCVHAGK